MVFRYAKVTVKEKWSIVSEYPDLHQDLNSEQPRVLVEITPETNQQFVTSVIVLE